MIVCSVYFYMSYFNPKEVLDYFEYKIQNKKTNIQLHINGWKKIINTMKKIIDAQVQE